MCDFISDVARGYKPIGRKFSLDGEIPLLDVRWRRIGERCRENTLFRIRRIPVEHEWKWIAAGIIPIRIIETDILQKCFTGPRWTLANGNVQLCILSFIEDPVSGANNRFTLAGRIPN